MSELLVGVISAVAGAVAGGLISLFLARQQFQRAKGQLVRENSTNELSRLGETVTIILMRRVKPIDRGTYEELRNLWDQASRRFYLFFRDDVVRQKIVDAIEQYLRTIDTLTDHHKVPAHEKQLEIERLRMSTVDKVREVIQIFDYY